MKSYIHSETIYKPFPPFCSSGDKIHMILFNLRLQRQHPNCIFHFAPCSSGSVILQLWPQTAPKHYLLGPGTWYLFSRGTVNPQNLENYSDTAISTYVYASKLNFDRKHSCALELEFPLLNSKIVLSTVLACSYS